MKKIYFIAAAVFCILTIGYYVHDNAIIRGYYDKVECYDNDGFQDYTDYCKYFYTEEYDEKFSKNKLYSLVSEDDIENILSYFRNFREWMNVSNRSGEYDFDNDIITTGDYVYIDSKEGKKIGSSYYEKFDDYNVYLYDIDSHTLYYIHNNI